MTDETLAQPIYLECPETVTTGTCDTAPPCDCNHVEAKCYNSRPRPDGTRIRRRQCQQCGRRFTTIEVVLDITGNYSEENLRESILRALGYDIFSSDDALFDALAKRLSKHSI